MFKYQNAQDYYNACIKASLDGKLPAKNEMGTCRYRDNKGNACLIGIGIPDEEYDSLLEGQQVCHIFVTNSHLKPKFASIEQLMEIQYIHDQEMTPYKWDHNTFIKLLNKCSLFKDCIKNEI